MTDELNKRYVETLEKFCNRFEAAMERIEKEGGTKMGYVFLIDRGNGKTDKTGLIDIASNGNTKSIIQTLEATLDSLREQGYMDDKKKES